jgi:hypothetical protein
VLVIERVDHSAIKDSGQNEQEQVLSRVRHSKSPQRRLNLICIDKKNVAIRTKNEKEKKKKAIE